MSFICIRIKKSFSYQYRRTEPRFETEAWGNWEMACKMQRILRPDWLPERARWAYLARTGFPALVPQQGKVLF